MVFVRTPGAGGSVTMVEQAVGTLPPIPVQAGLEDDHWETVEVPADDWLEQNANVAVPECAISPTLTDTPDRPILSPAFAEHLQQSPPEFLYHYTSQEGLLGIITSGSLWATNISYLNDATEFGLSLALIRDRLLDELQNRETETETAHFATTDPARAGRARERKERARILWRLTNTDASPICVTCFCEKGDLLSQWRGYAGGGYGYSLPFVPSKLKAIASGFLLGKCIYDPELQKKIITECAEYLLTKGASEELATLDDFWEVLTYGAFFKHPSFEQEQEWRLVSTLVYVPFFRKGKSMIIPYTLLPINSAENLGINHAFVGPCPHMELSTRSVSDMLQCNGIDVTVHPSAIPFRDW